MKKPLFLAAALCALAACASSPEQAAAKAAAARTANSPFNRDEPPIRDQPARSVMYC